MRRKFVGGNWKMNGNQSQLSELVKDILKESIDFSNLDVVLFPSFVYLTTINQLLLDSKIAIGAQNVSEQESGAYTGEVSISMLKDIGCGYTLVGHSERRHIYVESNELVAQKFKMAIQNDVIPVLCVGETQTEREQNKTEEIVLNQLNTVINETGIDAFAKAVIAYEPVWAIGTGLTATPEQAQAVHEFIRKTIAKHSSNISESISIVYGGSVKASNAKELFDMPDIDGGLIGGASLKATEFVSICKST